MRKIALSMFLLLVVVTMASGERFRFRYRKGEKYRVVGNVSEDVYINGVLNNKADIAVRTAIEVMETKDNSGLLQGQYQTSVRGTGSQGLYELNQDYSSITWRDEYGIYDIDPHYFMPVVRNVPTFPERDVGPGETWYAPGKEVHDFRRDFQIREPFSFPIHVGYKYVGKQEIDGIELDIISVRYSVYHRTEKVLSRTGIYPVRVSGYSHQQIYWDNLIGRFHSYNEEFEIVFDFSNGMTVIYKGTADAEIVEATAMDREQIAESIRNRLKEDRVQDADVRTDEKGVIISLENIQFLPDSAVLRDSEKRKLDTVGKILKDFPERDVLITGHTALAGTAEGRQKLSEERAGTVGRYLHSLGVREPEQLIIEGKGAREPLADNQIEAGRRKNRRVEITILEN